MNHQVALRGLVEAYARASDQRNVHFMATLFTVGGTLSLLSPDAIEVSFRGREQIAAMLASDFARMEFATHAIGSQVLHFGSVEADGVDDESPVTGETTYISYGTYQGPGGRRLLATAVRSEDAFRRVGGRWLFAARRMEATWCDDRELMAAS